MKIFSASFLLASVLVSRTWTSATTQTTTPHPWVFDCAKAGLVDTLLPPSGSGLERLLSCMVEESMTDRFNEEELTLRDRELHWCLPPSFLDRSCLSPQLDPYPYLVKCLFDYQILGSFYFYHNETQQGNVSQPFVNDTVVVAETIMRTMCTSIDGLRSPRGVSCLVEHCQTVSESPSSMPSDMPSMYPTMEPSAIPTITLSDSPSLAPSSEPSPSPTEEHSMQPSASPSTSRRTAAPTEFVDYPLRFPPLVLRMEIILKLVVMNLGDGLSLPPSDRFLSGLALAFDNVLMSTVEGHSSVEILFIDSVEETDHLSVFLRAVTIRECVDCAASDLADEMVNQYLSALKSASGSGSLSNQIEFHGFISGFPSLMNITIDPDSVESIALTNKNRVESEASVSAGVSINDLIQVFCFGLFVTAVLMM